MNTGPNGTPVMVWCRSRPLEVKRILQEWAHAGRWWRGEDERFYYLLELQNGWQVEVYREGQQWVLSAIQD